MAMPTWRARNSLRSSLAGLVSGTIRISRRTRRRSNGGGGGKFFLEAAFAIEKHPHHVFNVDEAEDVIHSFAVDGDAGTLRGGEHAHDFIERSFDGKGVHVRAGNHDFADLQLAEFDGAENELLFAGGEQAAFARLLNLNLEFFGGVGNAVPGGSDNAESLDDDAGGAVEEIDGPAKRVQKPQKGASHHERDALGAGEADAFSGRVRQRRRGWRSRRGRQG